MKTRQGDNTNHTVYTSKLCTLSDPQWAVKNCTNDDNDIDDDYDYELSVNYSFI